MTDWTLCIDFGTAYSKAAAAPSGAWSKFDPSLVRPLMLGGHDPRGQAFLLESAVFVDDDVVLFGGAAVAQAEALASEGRMALRSFKTILSAADLDRALNTDAPRAIDPHRQFQMRDLIVLYLAYLLAAIERAAADDSQVASASSITRRYAAPAWRGGQSASMHAVVMRLFGEAEELRSVLGDRLLSSDGLPVGLIGKVLPKAMTDAPPMEMGLIFEATAAAAYTSIGLENSASHLLVIDVGAGTTDITALARIDGRMVELTQARETLSQAGDFLDGVIANRVLDMNRRARSLEQQSELWASVMHQMRDIKETLFHDGQVRLRHEDQVIAIALRDIERDADFRAFTKTLTEIYDHALEAVREIAGKRSNVQAVAVGGGASLPFIQDLLRREPKRGGMRVRPRPATPEWAHTSAFKGNLAPVFPQLAISIGGALAPDDMLAAGGGLTPSRGGRTGSRAAPD